MQHQCATSVVPGSVEGRPSRSEVPRITLSPRTSPRTVGDPQSTSGCPIERWPSSFPSWSSASRALESDGSDCIATRVRAPRPSHTRTRPSSRPRPPRAIPPRSPARRASPWSSSCASPPRPSHRGRRIELGPAARPRAFPHTAHARRRALLGETPAGRKWRRARALRGVGRFDIGGGGGWEVVGATQFACSRLGIDSALEHWWGETPGGAWPATMTWALDHLRASIWRNFGQIRQTSSGRVRPVSSDVGQIAVGFGHMSAIST